ncbi:MAG TPA: nucleotidyltransferase family protein [Vicinamibacterales bacterium]
MHTPASILGRILTGRQSPAAAGVDAAALAEMARQHGVAGLLWERLPAGDPSAAALRDALADDITAAVVRDALTRREVERVAGALETAGVRALLVKGAALACTIYQQSWHRPRTDTDLLVAHADVPAASRALESCGYRRSDEVSTGEYVSYQMAFERLDPGGLRHVVDLHWKPVNPLLLADALPAERLWEEGTPLPGFTVSLVRVPSISDSVLLACVHRLAHHQEHERLIWLWDLKLLAGAMTPAQWARLADEASARQLAAVCLDGLRRARALLDSPLPGDVEAALEAAAASEPSRRYVEGPVSRRDVLVSDLRRLPDLSSRLRLLREHMFPSASFMRRRYGVNSTLLLPVLYLHRLVTGVSRWTRP